MQDLTAFTPFMFMTNELIEKYTTTLNYYLKNVTEKDSTLKAILTTYNVLVPKS